jgi:excinuclease ABC subunit C
LADDLKESVAAKTLELPHEPGVYLFKDQKGEVIYVGKALDLRQRVRSYFQKSAQKSTPPSPRLARLESVPPSLRLTSLRLNPRLRVLVEKIAALDFIVTDTEEEAFILESNLIKAYAPRYNVQFKDDKHYPYLRLNLQEPFPRLEVARKIEGKGFKYFGPYSRAGAVKETVRLIKKLFPLRSCRRPLQAGVARGRPCLNYQIKRCLAPCRGNVSPQEYAPFVEQVVLFLEGRQARLLKKIEREMRAAAKELKFEKAARLRDQYFSLQKIMEQQKAVTTDLQDRDIIALVELPRGFSIGLFKVRAGKLLGADNFTPVTAAGEDAGEIMKEFLRHYYDQAAFVPGELLVSHLPSEKELLAGWLQKKRNNKKVRMRVPQRGEKKALLELLKKNILLQVQEKQGQIQQKEHALQELARVLSLPEPPQRIEGYDISHLAGQETAGALVVFLQGQACKEEYRRFKIRTAAPGDDYAALAEVLQRRFSREDWPSPSLVLVDGGRGQLSAAQAALKEKGRGDLPVVALAEKEEQIYLPGEKAPLSLPAVHPALQLLQQVRDEAHRFALAFSRELLVKSSLASFLETIPGIGPVRRKALLQHFGGMEALREASREEIEAVPGISSAVATRLYNELHQN